MLFYVCQKCGRPLTNPISMELGMGAICRIDMKNTGTQNLNLFAMRSSYDVAESFPGALVIMDHDNGKSVTNDIENVLKDLQGMYGSLDSYKIMYMDTQGVYDGIEHRNGKFVSFFSINERDGNLAYEKLMGQHKTKLIEA